MAVWLPHSSNTGLSPHWAHTSRDTLASLLTQLQQKHPREEGREVLGQKEETKSFPCTAGIAGPILKPLQWQRPWGGIPTCGTYLIFNMFGLVAHLCTLILNNGCILTLAYKIHENLVVSSSSC